jgi:hypothetical protein
MSLTVNLFFLGFIRFPLHRMLHRGRGISQRWTPFKTAFRGPSHPFVVETDGILRMHDAVHQRRAHPATVVREH